MDGSLDLWTDQAFYEHNLLLVSPCQCDAFLVNFLQTILVSASNGEAAAQLGQLFRDSRPYARTGAYSKRKRMSVNCVSTSNSL